MTKSIQPTFGCANTPADLKEGKTALQALFSSVFEKELSDRAWEHFYLNGPWGPAVSFQCFIGNRLVGHAGLIPQKLIAENGKEVDYFLQTGVMIHEEYRNLKLFNDLMQMVHQFVEKRNSFTLSFPNKKTYLPFVKMLRWREVTSYNIIQYKIGGDSGSGNQGERAYAYKLPLTERFLSWRGELNSMRVSETNANRVVHKVYEGALEILDISCSGLNFAEFSAELGFDRTNIADCHLQYGSPDGLLKVDQVGIPQRLCIFPPQNDQIAYERIKPSLLLSDVF